MSKSNQLLIGVLKSIIQDKEREIRELERKILELEERNASLTKKLSSQEEYMPTRVSPSSTLLEDPFFYD